jgi:hypothetical protein
LLNKGVFTITIDTELAWGVIDKSRLRQFERYFRGVRPALDSLLRLFEKYQISATWPIVGHLFLDGCSSDSGLPHNQIVRPDYIWQKEDWFARDPCSYLDKAPFWYGRDIVDKISACRIEQEIACHSFSHLLFNDDGCTPSAAASDIRECVRLAGERNLSLSSFAFPRNGVGHLDILSSYGFKCYRGEKPLWFKRTNKLPKPLIRLLAFANDFFPTAPPCSEPRVSKEGMVQIDESMVYRRTGGTSAIIPHASRVIKGKRGLKKAVRKKLVFCLRFHLFDFGLETSRQMQSIEKIIQYADLNRRRGDLYILPMKALCDNILEGST